METFSLWLIYLGSIWVDRPLGRVLTQQAAEGGGGGGGSPGGAASPEAAGAFPRDLTLCSRRLSRELELASVRRRYVLILPPTDAISQFALINRGI